MPNTKPSTTSVDQYFDQLVQLAETTGSHVYLAVVHARASTRHLESAMEQSEKLTTDIAELRKVTTDLLDQNQQTITTLTATVADLKAHPNAPDLQGPIDSIEQLIADVKSRASNAANVTSDSPANDATGSISSIGM
jgi:hypothetical protein